MRRFASPAIVSAGLVVVIALATGALAAKDDPPDRPSDSAGRFSMSPVDSGFVRLDSQTGQMSMCNRKDNQWLCADMPDQGRGLAEEIERLRAENKNLKADIRRMEDIMVGDGRAAKPPAGLPSEQDVDQALSYMQRMFRKFRDKMKEFESDNKGTPL